MEDVAYAAGGTFLIIALENARHELIDMREKLQDLGGALRIEDLAARVAELEQKTADPSFWADPNSAKVLQELKQSKDTIAEYEALCARLEDAIALAEIAIEAEDESCVEEVEAELAAIVEAEDAQRMEVLLNGEYVQWKNSQRKNDSR